MSFAINPRNIILLIALSAIAGTLYLPGLSGGLIFDDRPNLEPLYLWLTGEISWQQVLLGNSSGPLGRPVSMASFLVNIKIAGDSVTALKAGNLLLHLSTGLALYAFLRGIIVRDRHLAAHHSWIPLALTAVWLLHPMMVGTVLYVVQRMAILSAFFVLAALTAFVYGRHRIESGQLLSGSVWLFIGVPALTLFAALSKENGLLAPLLCGVIEWVYFAPGRAGRRAFPARAFTFVFIAIPMTAAALLLLFEPGFYLDGYDNRPFSPVERILTQSRVLFDYTGNLLLPAGPTFSLLRDDYQISSGLFSPATTLFATVGWLLLGFMAIALRMRLPGFSAGISIFLVGHMMESTIFPLLIYFEHRNYLPSIGIFLAVSSLLAASANRLQTKLEHPRRIVRFGLAGLLIVLAAGTFARATVWASNETLVRQALAKHPSSVHLLMELQHIQMTKPNPDVLSARQLSRKLLDHELPSTQLIGMLNLVRIDCVVDGETDGSDLDRAFEIQPEIIQADLLTTFEALGSVIRQESCTSLPPERMADGIVKILEQNPLPETLAQKWRLRFLAAKLYYSGEKALKAYSQAHRAWIDSGNSPAVGLMLLGLQINLDMLDSASALSQKLDELIAPSDYFGRSYLERYRDDLNRRLFNIGNSNVGKLNNSLQEYMSEPN